MATSNDLPPVPEKRVISPAREDYATCTPITKFVTPVFWIGVFVVLTLVVVAAGWPATHAAH